MNAVVLIGLSGTGKTTVGQLVACRLGVPFVDTDDMIAARAGKPVHRIFADEGEKRFRDMEAAAVAAVARLGRCVVATGGGAVLRPANRELLRAGNLVVWLDAPAEVLAARLQGHTATPQERPLLRGSEPLERLKALAAARSSLYAECAGLRVDTAARDAEGVAAEICAAVSRWQTEGHDE